MHYMSFKYILCAKFVFRAGGWMTKLIYLMDWESHFFQANTAIREQLASTPYVRHYMQEESFAVHAQGPRVELPFNHLINQIVSELSIMSKVIAANSKLTTSLLENGRDIFLKKRQYFQQFCRENTIIGDALALLPAEVRLVFEYSVMALSNLILKLSINMAKISIVVVSRFLMPSYLNLFTVALLFEKYLELQLVRGKNFANPDEHRHFLKQFPKISVIRLSKRRNPYDLEFITRSQTEFNKYKTPFPQKATMGTKAGNSQEVRFPQNATMGTQERDSQEARFPNMATIGKRERELPEVCNMQLIQFFEQQEEEVMLTNRTPRRSPRHEAFNLSQTFGIYAPYGFELLLLVSEIVITKMTDFKPDIILYIEDFDDVPLVDARVRGLILNQLSEKVQHKIYVLREFGVTEAMKSKWLDDHQQQETPQFSWEFSKKMSDIMAETHASFIDGSDNFAAERRFSMENYIKQNMRITSEVFKKLQDYFKAEYRKASILLENSGGKELDTVFVDQLRTLHKNSLEDLNYLSLALIQKSNFEETLSAYHNYIFPQKFLEKTLFWLGKELQQIERERVFSQIGEGYKSKIEKLVGMHHLSGSPQSQNQFVQTKFFNFLTGKQEYLKYIDLDNPQPHQLTIAKEDSFYVAYVENYIIVFLFTDDGYGIYRKRKMEPCFTIVKKQKFTERNIGLSKRHSACVANGKYFYKAFGEAKDPTQNKQSQIYRIQIERPENLEKKDWVMVAKSCLVYSTTDKSKKTAIPLQFKRHGFGFSYDTEQNQKKVNITLFGGGYNFKIENQQKINRFFYIIRDNSNEVFKIGKTNNDIVNQTENMRNKVLIYPFVYGIPFAASPTELIVLNTNGYLQNINNFKKFFLTKVKTGPMVGLSSIGIVAQNKLDYQSQSPEIAMANKNTILSYVINSYHRVNRLGNRVALYNSDGEILLMECLKATEADKFDIVRVEPANSREMSEHQDTLSLCFASKKMTVR